MGSSEPAQHPAETQTDWSAKYKQVHKAPTVQYPRANKRRKSLSLYCRSNSISVSQLDRIQKVHKQIRKSRSVITNLPQGKRSAQNDCSKPGS